MIALAAAHHHVTSGAGSGLVVALFVFWLLWLVRDKSGAGK